MRWRPRTEMEPPSGRDFGAVHDEKAKVFQAMRPLTPDDDTLKAQLADFFHIAGVGIWALGMDGSDVRAAYSQVYFGDLFDVPYPVLVILNLVPVQAMRG